MIFVITNDVLNATVPFPRGDNLIKIVHFQRPGKSPIVKTLINIAWQYSRLKFVRQNNYYKAPVQGKG